MKKIIVTGSSGQLGKEIVKQLKQHYYKVLGIDIIASETTDKIVDIRNRQAVEEVTIGYDAIIHTAALHGKHTNLNYPAKSLSKPILKELSIYYQHVSTITLRNFCIPVQHQFTERPW
nr:NAD-dependent epimerase/dehydratase family protein [uncultured Draconibacterium sp.]